MRKARQTLRPYRAERNNAVREFVGGHWSETTTFDRSPVNLLALYTSIVSQNLIAKNPRVMLSTFQRQHKPAVAAMQTWGNDQIKKIRLVDQLQRMVIDALFLLGIMKVGLAAPADSAITAFALKAGEAYAETIDFDDFVFDVHARDFSEVSFIGHRFRAPLEVIRDSPLYSAARKDLSASIDPRYNQEGDERLSALGRGNYASDSEEFEDFVDLWEVYCPRHKCVYTLADDYLVGASAAGIGSAVVPLREQEWIGPDRGPYHMLSFEVVPGNPLPQGPIQRLRDLNSAANHIMRKLIDQAERQKEVLGVRTGATEDGERVMKANDGDIIRIDNPESMKVAGYGGPNQQNWALFMELKNLFDMLGGNLSIMGGLSPQSKTATQDKMLNENSSRGIADKQERTIVATESILEALFWYWWKDPFKVMQTTHTLPGLPEMTQMRQLGPGGSPSLLTRDAPWEQLALKVDPYSLLHQTPQSRMAAIMQIVKEMYLPLAQIAQGQGIMLDLNFLMRKAAEYLDQPDLVELFTITEPPEQQTGTGAEQQGGMPAQTERTYNRVSTPGRTDKGNQQNMQAALMNVDNGGAPESNGAMNGAA